MSEFRRVSFELPAEDVPELLDTLNDFVLAHNVSVEFADPEQDVPNFNPERVEWFTDEHGKKVPVITEYLLKQFQNEQATKPDGARTSMGAVSRVYSATRWRAREEAPNSVTPFVVTEQGQMVGFRAENFQQYAQSLVAGDIWLHRVGRGSAQLLLDYCKDLYLPEPDQATS